MIVWLRDVYQIPILATLVILGAETSLGDLTGQGGPLAESNNFGCIKAASKGAWADTAGPPVTVRGTEWHTWPDAQTGMDAWGVYLSTYGGGVYLELLRADKWLNFANIYYGADVAGFAAYMEDLLARVSAIRAKAAKAGHEL